MTVSRFCLNREIWLPHPRESVFEFFSDPRNLEKLTPGWLRFEVLDPDSIAMKTGATIDYRLRLRGLPLRWRSQIALWDPPRRFVDVQVRGPYREWIHEHRFESRSGGTAVADRVDYAVLGGPLVNRLLVRRDLERIFDYRSAALVRLFGNGTAGPDGADPAGRNDRP